MKSGDATSLAVDGDSDSGLPSGHQRWFRQATAVIFIMSGGAVTATGGFGTV